MAPAQIALLAIAMFAPGAKKNEVLMQLIRYRAIAPLKLQKRLGPGTLTLEIDAQGKVTGLFAPGGIAGPGKPNAKTQSFALPPDRARAEKLAGLLDRAHFHELPTRTTIRMGEGEPIGIERQIGSDRVKKTFAQTEIPPPLEPFLTAIRALAEELADHPAP